MANHKSAKKRAKQNVKRRACNKSYESKVKTAIKKFKLAVSGVASVGQDTIQNLYVDAQSLLQKAATKGVLHRNNASRRVARMNELLKKASAKKA